MLTGSWKTTVMGYLMVVLTVANQVFAEQGLPSTAHEWIAFVGGIVTGVGIALSKDSNVSNSPIPVAAQVVSPVNEAKPNPAV